MDKKWRKSIFQLLALNGRDFLTVALTYEKIESNTNEIFKEPPNFVLFPQFWYYFLEKGKLWQTTCLLEPKY